KNISKRSPGLECNKCAKIVHANQLCSSLSSKQLSALRNADNLEWTCEECRRELPRRSSFVIPEEDEEEVDEAGGYSQCNMFDMAKLLRNIYIEVKKVVQSEMVLINDSVGGCRKKIDDLTDTLEVFSGKIKELETSNTHLVNQNKHLELKMAAIEQHLRKI
ncbi:Membrane fusion protein, partial [Operophtera brumata]